MGPDDDDRVLLDQVTGGRVEYPRMDEAYDIVGINLELSQFTMIIYLCTVITTIYSIDNIYSLKVIYLYSSNIKIIFIDIIIYFAKILIQ